MKIVWSPLAIDRVIEIAQYIAFDNPTAAQKWTEKVFDKVKTLAISPKMGRRVPEMERDEIREIIFGNYRIIYHISVQKISILTVRHGNQILPAEEIME